MKKISVITLLMLLVLMPAAAYRVVQHAQSNFTQNGEPVAEAPAPAAPAATASKSSAKAEKVKGSSMQMTNYGKGAGISVGRGASATGSGGSADSSAGGSGVGGGMGGAAGAANAASAEMNEQRKKCQEKLNCTYCLDEKQKDRCHDCRMTLMQWGMFSSATAYYRENPDRNAWTCNWNLNSNEVLVQKNSGSNKSKTDKSDGENPSGRDGNVLRPDVDFERGTSARTDVVTGRNVEDVIHPATDLSRGGSSGTGTNGRNGNTISPTGGRSSGSNTSKTTLTRNDTGNTRASQTPVTTRTRAESLK